LRLEPTLGHFVSQPLGSFLTVRLRPQLYVADSQLDARRIVGTAPCRNARYAELSRTRTVGVQSWERRFRDSRLTILGSGATGRHGILRVARHPDATPLPESMAGP
jgi:hypothetical protein